MLVFIFYCITDKSNTRWNDIPSGVFLHLYLQKTILNFEWIWNLQYPCTHGFRVMVCIFCGIFISFSHHFLPMHVFYEKLWWWKLHSNNSWKKKFIQHIKDMSQPFSDISETSRFTFRDKKAHKMTIKTLFFFSFDWCSLPTLLHPSHIWTCG